MATFETTNYGTVETALVNAYGIPDKARGAFRSRLGALQKAALFGTKSMPGKGHALTYGLDQIWRLIFACECLEFGIPPTTLLSIINTRWPHLQKIFKLAEDAAERELGPGDVILIIPTRYLTEKAAPEPIACVASRLPEYLARLMKPNAPRLLITNLSMRLRTFHFEAILNARPRPDLAIMPITTHKPLRLAAKLQ